ncbi:MAG: RNA polymerase sigma factor [Planctomycetes bacterium]|nr:RNA polymerase sigma factor [Planctomycetota bacterium]
MRDDAADGELIEECRRGSREAFFALYHRHEAAVFRFARRMLGDEDAAADVVQDVFEYFFRKIPEYRPEAKTTTFLLKAARNRCLNAIEKRRLRKAAPLEETGDLPAAGGASPGEAAERADLAAAALRAIESLPPDARETIALKVERDLTYAEIGEILGVPEGTVKSRLHNALELVRKKMGLR